MQGGARAARRAHFEPVEVDTRVARMHATGSTARATRRCARALDREVAALRSWSSPSATLWCAARRLRRRTPRTARATDRLLR
jgi:hypothetical protein